jgi:hypothetical protein
MRQLAFIRAGLSVSPLVIDRVQDIVPRIRAAMSEIAEAEKEMQAADVERM